MAEFSSLSTVRKMATQAFTAPKAETLGRFELRRVLGQGAQSVVWLGFDPRLEREVAIKIIKASEGSTGASVAHWLQEARSVSRLQHPNIVPVFEADVQDNQPYLVFEYVQGNTLQALLKASGALPAHEAVPLMVGVLEALAAAHAAGVVHRDMKPSNVLVDETGRARVMDFGIAARAQKAGSKAVTSAGTPGYLSPEAARGDAPCPAMDVFSAGLVLGELLTGTQLLLENDPYRAMYRLLHEQITFPQGKGPAVDGELRAIVMNALARDASHRYPSAQAFRDALVSWSKPPAIEPEPAGTSLASGNSTLEFLLRRMRFKTDFPAMSDAVVRIQSIVSSDNESLSSLTNEILKDVALTNKLLRLVNSAHYSRGGSEISTVSRAVSLVGFTGIRNMALSLVLLEHMPDKENANLLKEEFLRSLLAGSIASELCPSQRESEEAFIGSMFRNLGRLLTQFYFADDAREIRNLMATARQPMTEQAAATKVLGLSFEDLGIGVAKVWGLPDGIQRCMRQPQGKPPGNTSDAASERVRWISSAANEIADTLLQADPKIAEVQLELVAKRQSGLLGMDVKLFQAATTKARERITEQARAMDLKVLPGSRAFNLLQVPSAKPAETEASIDTLSDSLYPHQLQATQTGLMPLADKFDPQVELDMRRITETLAAGIQDITNAMVEEFKLSDVVRMVLETMFRAMGFQRIIFCMRDVKTDTLTGRFGLGQDIEKLASQFKVPLKMPASAEPDLFSAVCIKGVDTMIRDASEPHLAKRLPAWYRQAINAPTFLLLPLQLKSAPFGLIYADKSSSGGMDVDEKQLALLRTLRNQAIMAFRQSA